MITTSHLSLLFIVLQCLLIFQPALSQTIVDRALCKAVRLPCGDPGGSFNEKYCCNDGNGGPVVLKCCNPYIALIIGLSVGVPVIIAIIIGVIVLYCCCASYHNKKMTRLAVAYSRNRNLRNSGDTSLDAPPPYTRTDDQEKDSSSDLPSYSVVDPYATPRVPTQVPTTSEELESPEQELDAANQQTNVAVLEDVPLLSD